MITFSSLGKMGQFGNQLFQIASTIGIAASNNVEFVFPEWQYSHYFKNKLPLGIIKNATVHIQRLNSTSNSINLSHGNWDLLGFFQSEAYFIKARELVRYYFSPSEIVEKYINCQYSDLFDHPKTCSIHVRRGDYLNQPFHFPSQTPDYYRRAMKIMGNDSRFILFSDDISWCKKQFSELNIYYIENESEVIDLFLMSRCQNHIISNSSFSWWGAWLNQSNTKRVLCPDIWFGPAKEFVFRKSKNPIYLSYFEKIETDKKYNLLIRLSLFLFYKFKDLFNSYKLYK